ncbi:O-antigen ligase family protein [Helicobacter anatolicus]|uniref:O-antigen ligase family protein n=1 Tax=Helicobacter anatolicus TaxID=2905874 RepID=UPI001E380237|nr:O-antigen ligase family protein [Helicobacter anatolicus]MCE3040510.1 O-antigen ligase family protein [Helicobacter anatolicus]
MGRQQYVTKLDYLAGIVLSVFFLLAPHRAGSAIGAILFLIVFCVASFFGAKKKLLHQKEKFYIAALFGFFFSAVLSYIFGKGWEFESSRHAGWPSLFDLDLASKYLIMSLVTYYFWKIPFRFCANFVFILMAISACLCGMIGIFQRFVLGIDRVHAWSGIIEFADICGIFSVMLLAIFAMNTGKIKILYFLGILLSFLACLLSGTRGSILSAVVGAIFVVFLVFFYQRKYSKQALFGLLAFGISFLFIIGLKGQADYKRVALVNSDLKEYQQGEVHTSIGLRFEMWKEAVAMWKMAPIFGLSTAEIKAKSLEIKEKSKSRIERENVYTDWIGRKHNQFLTTLAKKGIVGLVALFCVWAGMVALVLPFVRNENPLLASCSIAVLGMLCFSILPNSLIGDIWDTNVSVFSLLLLFAIFFKLIKQKEMV